MPGQTDHDQEDDQEKHGAGEEQAEILQAPVERSLLGPPGEAGGDVAERCLGAGRHDQGARSSADDGSTHEDHVPGIGLGGDLLAARLLFDRQRFARQ